MKRYLITGGSSGVGLALARLLVANGDHVTLVSRSVNTLLKTQEELSVAQCDVVADDLSIDPVETANRLIRLLTLNPVHGIFHGAGVEMIRPAYTAKPSHLDTAPLYGLMAIARSAHRILHTGGSIVAMSSVAAHRGSPALMLYSAGKAAVEAAVRSLAVELAPTFRVNAIAAGAFNSPMHERIWNGMGPAARAEYERTHPLGFGTAEDVAKAAAFLLMEEASRWITGTTLVVDGGYLARG